MRNSKEFGRNNPNRQSHERRITAVVVYGLSFIAIGSTAEAAIEPNYSAVHADALNDCDGDPDTSLLPDSTAVEAITTTD